MEIVKRFASPVWLAVAAWLLATPALAAGVPLSDDQLDAITAGTTSVAVDVEVTAIGDNTYTNAVTRTRIRTIDTRKGELTIAVGVGRGIAVGDQTSGSITVSGEGDKVFATASVKTIDTRRGEKTFVRGRVIAISFTPTATQ